MTLKTTDDMIGTLQQMHELKGKILDLHEELFSDKDLLDRLYEVIKIQDSRRAEYICEQLKKDGNRIEAQLDELQRHLSTATGHVIDAKFAANKRRYGSDNVVLR